MDENNLKLIFGFLFIILLFGNVTALDSMGTFKEGQQIRITQICYDSTYITLTSVSFPNSTLAINQTNMSNAGNGEFYYIFTNTSTIGRYDVRGISDGCDNTFSFYFDVTKNGDKIETGTSLIYFLVTLFAFGIFFIITWLFLNINGENPKDETGYLGINYRKYIKTALFPLVYVSFLWFFNFIIGLSNNYLGLTLYANTLNFLFLILAKLVYPIIAVTFIIEIVLMVKDNNIKKEYETLWSRF